MIEDFNFTLKLYSKDLAIALGTALAGNKDQKINFQAVQNGEMDFLTPSKNGGQNKMLHDFHPNDPDFQKLVDVMVLFVTSNHKDFVTKKANEIAEEYYANMDKRVETLWTEGLKEASASPIDKKKFMQETYLNEVAEEFFSIDKDQL